MWNLATFVLLATAHALPVSFSSGNQFRVNIYRGEVIANCLAAGGTSQTFLCDADELSPAEFDRIQAHVDADSVSLHAIHADGSSITRTRNFNAKKGLSGEFNLWISSLFQSPLLNMGTNKINYTFTKNGQTVATGEFAVTVSSGTNKSCQILSIFPTSAPTCDSQFSACQAYYQNDPVCR